MEEEIHSNFNCIVFHTAPLPYGRGSPIQNLILNEIKEAPVCALKMTSELDSGPIYTKRTISLDGSLHQILKKINTAINIMIEELIINLPEPKEQVGEVFTFERLSLADNELQTNKSLKFIYDQIRMVDSSDYPNAYINLGKFKIEFYEAEFDNDTIEAKCLIQINERVIKNL